MAYAVRRPVDSALQPPQIPREQRISHRTLDPSDRQGARDEKNQRREHQRFGEVAGPDRRKIEKVRLSGSAGKSPSHKDKSDQGDERIESLEGPLPGAGERAVAPSRRRHPDRMGAEKKDQSDDQERHAALHNAAQHLPRFAGGYRLFMGRVLSYARG